MRADSSDADAAPPDVLRVRDLPPGAADALLASHGLQLHFVDDAAPIPGSFWGEPEAGVIVLPAERRAQVHTDATDSVIEEDATCCLQIILADDLPGVGRHRLMGDMDAWGYTYRLGSTRAWFEQDADDARAFLKERGLPHR